MICPNREMCLNVFRKSCVKSICGDCPTGSRPPIPAGNRRSDLCSTKNEYRGSGNRHYGVFKRWQEETSCFFFRRRGFGAAVDEIEPEDVVKGLPNAGRETQIHLRVHTKFRPRFWPHFGLTATLVVKQTWKRENSIGTDRTFERHGEGRCSWVATALWILQLSKRFIFASIFALSKTSPGT